MAAWDEGAVVVDCVLRKVEPLRFVFDDGCALPKMDEEACGCCCCCWLAVELPNIELDCDAAGVGVVNEKEGVGFEAGAAGLLNWNMVVIRLRQRGIGDSWARLCHR